ncbi:MAG TPA: helix-turn-helix domain-containing protein [Rhodoferax sp.]|jgi:AraC family transcriptional activator of pobA|nr:helix-turn-helix domain-containing protein [Rhodoferax sp.]HPW28095.1 helix-turn-helix domain-containing protein [Rhodoferax sp.]
MQKVRTKTGNHNTLSAIPAFALYGETAEPGQELLHIEEVQSRSSLYQWEISPHVHKGLYQVLWVNAGTVKFALDTVEHSHQGPLAIVVPPGVVHGFRFAPGTDGLVLTLSARFMVEGEFRTVGEAFRTAFASAAVLPLATEALASSRLSALLRNLADEFSLPSSTDSPVVLWLARAVVWHLAQIRPAPSDSRSNRALRQRTQFTRFLVLIEEHFLEHWSLEQYAARMGLTTQRLNRLVRDVNGQSALEVVHERLTREACRRLRYIAAPVANLASEMGFDDAAYFSRFFKKRTGLTPLEYRLGRNLETPKTGQAGAH